MTVSLLPLSSPGSGLHILSPRTAWTEPTSWPHSFSGTFQHALLSFSWPGYVQGVRNIGPLEEGEINTFVPQTTPLSELKR